MSCECVWYLLYARYCEDVGENDKSFIFQEKIDFFCRTLVIWIFGFRFFFAKNSLRSTAFILFIVKFPEQSGELTFETDASHKWKGAKATIKLARHQCFATNAAAFQRTLRTANVRLVLGAATVHRPITVVTRLGHFVVHCRAFGHWHTNTAARTTATGIWSRFIV